MIIVVSHPLAETTPVPSDHPGVHDRGLVAILPPELSAVPELSLQLLAERMTFEKFKVIEFGIPSVKKSIMLNAPGRLIL